jgi:hypothetical protein
MILRWELSVCFSGYDACPVFWSPFYESNNIFAPLIIQFKFNWLCFLCKIWNWWNFAYFSTVPLFNVYVLFDTQKRSSPSVVYN